MIVSRLLDWSIKNRRPLPWRSIPRNPYHVLVSEFMLQQTQVSRVLPKYEAFLARFPTIGSLASASQSEVVVLWAGLGYNRRARYLYACARTIMQDLGGVFPSDSRSLEKLPGVGPYTARALRVFAFGEQTYMIDTNIRRVIGRLFLGMLPQSGASIESMAAQLVPADHADAWHQGLMDFGSAVCLAIPHCDSCPLADVCLANIQARESGYQTCALYKKATTRPAKGRIPFRQTDRYFRGRIVDRLRAGPIQMPALQAYVVDELGLTDLVRFGTLIEALMQESMIHILGSTVELS